MSVLERQLRIMAQMQDQHNLQVHPQWRTQGHAYFRAVWVECAEMLDHYGWKWWKHQDCDLDQVRLELVDIWHFGLSELLRDGTISADNVGAGVLAEMSRIVAASSTGGGEKQQPEVSDVHRAIEILASQTLMSQRFTLAPFVDLMAVLPMHFDELFRMYVGKNVLNNFRQANGYSTGAYRKNWAGREDNAHLMELTRELDPGAADYPDVLYMALEKRYLASA